MYKMMGEFFPHMDDCVELLKGNRDKYREIREGSPLAAVLGATAGAAEQPEEAEAAADAAGEGAEPSTTAA